MHLRFRVLVSLVVLPGLIDARTTSSHTFFSMRPNFQSAMPERVSLFRNELLDENQGVGGAIEIVAFGGKTTKEGRGKLAGFFLPPGCTTTTLHVKEFNPVKEARAANTDDGNPLKDLEARHFNIRTVEETFASTITILPEQSIAAVGFAYKQTLSAKCDGTPGFWFELSFPIERIMNRTNLCETIENDGGGPRDELGLDNSPRVGNMIDALSQCNWRFGRIIRKNQNKTGVGDVEFKFGYNSCNCDAYSLATYGTFVLPTGNRVEGKALFEPIVGNNRHFGISLGNSFAYQMWCRGRHTVTMYIDGNTRYLMSNNQVRSFDLVGKPWGRYMETYQRSEEASQAALTDDENSGTSGINVFTRCVRVSPHFQGSYNTAIILNRSSDCSSLMLEVGYNLFLRQAEVLDFECSNTISAAALKAVDGKGQTTLARTIKNNFIASRFTLEERYASISNCDIDVETAAHPATISNTFYGTVGYRWERECPFFVAFGGSYEFTTSEITTAPDRWLLWGKFGVTF